MKVNVHHAKTNLSKLILRAEAGEEIVIARDGKPVVRLVPFDSSPPRLFRPGALKDRLQVPADFLMADKEIEELFNRSPIMAKPSRRRSRATTPKR